MKAEEAKKLARERKDIANEARVSDVLAKLYAYIKETSMKGIFGIGRVEEYWRSCDTEQVQLIVSRLRDNGYKVDRYQTYDDDYWKITWE